MPLSPPKGVSEMQNGRFLSKIALRLKKVCCKVSLSENSQEQSCKAFIDLTTHAKIIGGGQPLLPEILDQTDAHWSKIADFQFLSTCSDSAVTPSEKIIN